MSYVLCLCHSSLWSIILKEIIDTSGNDDFSFGSHIIYCVLLPRVVRIETSFFFLAACLTALFQNSSQTGTTPRHLNTTFPVVFVYMLHTAAPDHNISCRLCLCATHRGTWPQDFPVVFVYVLHISAPDHKISCRLCLCDTHRGTWPQHFLSSLLMRYTPRHLATTFPVVFVYVLPTAAPEHNISCRLLFMCYTPWHLTTRFPVFFVCELHTVAPGLNISCRLCLFVSCCKHRGQCTQ
jgi:hypothetical protein